MKAIQVSAYGGPEVLAYGDVAVPQPKAGEALVRIGAIGVNFIDVYHRTGRYPGNPPFTPGMEAAGVVSAAKLVPVPDGVNDQQAAAIMLQGMTAHYLARSTYPIRPGDTVLVHAGAGGVGLLLTQIAKHAGGRVITTVSTEEKAALSREAGADHVILYTETDFEAEVKRITEGKGVHAVYDGVGKTTFDKSLNCLRPRGCMALFGASSGPVPPLDPLVLSGKGSLFLTRPTLAHYALDRQELRWRSSDLFGWLAGGSLTLRIEHTYPLADAARAHRDLEGRATTGKLLLLP